MTSNNSKATQEALTSAYNFLVNSGYNIASLSVYGSQNYGLDVYTKDYTSDVDFKAVIIPTLRDLVDDSKPLSKVIDFEDGQIDIKDIRVFVDTLVKCNPAYIETLYSAYTYDCDDWMLLRNLRDILVTEMAPFFAKACYGMALEKREALCHPYPSTKDKIDKYGYDPKQLHHICRLAELMNDFYIH